MLRMVMLSLCFLCFFQQDISAERVWYPLNSGITDSDIRSISIFPGNVDFIAAATPKRMYFSEDGANFWREIFSLAGGEGEINFVSFSRSNSKIIYLATTKGLFATVNQGEDWRRIFRSIREPANNVTWITLDPFDYRKIYIGTEEGLFFSQDLGNSWQKASTDLPHSEVRAIAIHPGNSCVLYLANTYGLYQSIDSGYSWERIYVSSHKMIDEEDEESLETGESKNLVNCIAIDRHYPGKIFIATNKGVFISPDTGRTWNRLPVHGLNANYINFIVISPDKQDGPYIATENGAFEFSSDLNKWQEIYQGMSARDVRTLAFNKNRKQLFAGTDKGVFRTAELKIKVSPEKEEKVEIGKESQGDFDSIFKELSQNEPTIREVQEAALGYAEVVQPERIKTLRRNAKLKAFLPDVSVDYDKTIKDGGTTDNFGRFVIGPRDWGLSLSWDVGDLVYNEQVRLIDSQARLMVQLRDDILNEVTRLYYERRKLQTNLILTAPENLEDKLAKTLRLEELTANIDALTGGYFSGRIESCAK